MGAVGQNKQTSDEQVLINDVVQFEHDQLKGTLHWVAGAKLQAAVLQERGVGAPVSMSKKADAWSPGYGDPRVSTPFSSLHTTHTHTIYTHYTHSH